MKKINKILLVIVLMLPMIIDAKTLKSSITYANDYVNLLKDYEKYLVTGDETKYHLKDSALELNPLFKTGGFISETEYYLSQKTSTDYTRTYLYDGTEYWTLSQDISGKYTYVGQNGLVKGSNVTDSGTRVTEYIKDYVRVSGSGSINNPYTFLPEYNVTIVTNDEEYGTLGKVKITNDGKKDVIEVVESGLTSVTDRVYQGANALVKLEPKPGYKYLNSSCGSDVALIENNTVFKIPKVTKDTTCKINYGIGIFAVNLDRNCANGTDGTTQLYLKFNEG